MVVYRETVAGFIPLQNHLFLFLGSLPQGLLVGNYVFGFIGHSGYLCVKQMHNLMKKLICILVLALLSVSLANAQEKMTRVVLKNGTVLSGELVELDPTSHLVIRISGIESRIDMEKVASVQADAVNTHQPQTEEEDLFEENLNVPETITLNVGEEQFEMVLIHGGDFMMGYDGRHSLEMKSEPVHQVRVNSFYVSKRSLSNAVVSAITGKKVPFYYKADENSIAFRWSIAEGIVKKLADMTALPVRFPTEAEWEYMAAGSGKDLLDFLQDEKNWCGDYFDSYYETNTIQVNPTGPAKGKYHVIREFDYYEGEIYRRRSSKDDYESISIRVVIPAAAIQ